MPAFEHAVALGYRYLETDVHTSVDGQLFAFHDEHLGRVSDTDAYIADLTAAEIADVDVSGECVPRLEDLLLAWPDVRFNIDPKADAAVEPLAQLIEQLDAIERVCVGAFSDRRIAYFRDRFGPDLCTSMGPDEVRRLYSHSRGFGGSNSFAPLVQIPPRWKGLHLTSDRFIECTRELSIEVHVWTVDEPSEMADLIDAGVQGIMTDQPQVLRDVLIERSEWRSVPVAPFAPVEAATIEPVQDQQFDPPAADPANEPQAGVSINDNE